MSTNNLKKDERIDFRVNAEIKSLFVRAADLTGMSMSAFILEAARERAIKLLEQNERLTLNNRARDVFLKALAKPPVPNAALRRAAKKYSEK